MALFKSNIRSRVMAKVNPLIEQGEKEHSEMVKKAHEDYLTTVSDAAAIRDDKKRTAEDTIVSKII